MSRPPSPERPPNPALLRPRDLLNLSGALTLSRFPMAAVFPFVAPHREAAMALYFVVGLTDFFDGYAARKLNQVSHIGAVLDGWLDKIFHVNAAWSLVIYYDMPAWWMVCWFSREIVQGAQVPFLVGRFAEGKVRPHHANAIGKLTTWLLAAAIFSVLLGETAVAAALTPIIGLLGLVAALGYLRRFQLEQAAMAPTPAPAPAQSAHERLIGTAGWVSGQGSQNTCPPVHP